MSKKSKPPVSAEWSTIDRIAIAVLIGLPLVAVLSPMIAAWWYSDIDYLWGLALSIPAVMLIFLS